MAKNTVFLHKVALDVAGQVSINPIVEIRLPTLGTSYPAVM